MSGYYSIYVIECEDGKYYVGKSLDAGSRIDAHMNQEGSEWTKQHRALHGEVVEIVQGKEESSLAETSLTLQYMAKYGIDNVRGGPWTARYLSKDTVREIRKLIRHEGDQCFRCGEAGHVASDCAQGSPPTTTTNTTTNATTHATTTTGAGGQPPPTTTTTSSTATATGGGDVEPPTNSTSTSTGTASTPPRRQRPPPPPAATRSETTSATAAAPSAREPGRPSTAPSSSTAGTASSRASSTSSAGAGAEPRIPPRNEAALAELAALEAASHNITNPLLLKAQEAADEGDSFQSMFFLFASAALGVAGFVSGLVGSGSTNESTPERSESAAPSGSSRKRRRPTYVPRERAVRSRPNVPVCRRCRRTTHLTSSCVETVNVNGRYILDD